MDKKINKIAKFLVCEFRGTLENIAIEETEALKINAKFFAQQDQPISNKHSSLPTSRLGKLCKKYLLLYSYVQMFFYGRQDLNLSGILVTFKHYKNAMILMDGKICFVLRTCHSRTLRINEAGKQGNMISICICLFFNILTPYSYTQTRL